MLYLVYYKKRKDMINAIEVTDNSKSEKYRGDDKPLAA